MSSAISINIQEIEPAQSVHHSARSKTISYLVAQPNTITSYRHDLISINIDKSNLDNVHDYFKLHTMDIKADYQKNNNNRSMQKNTKVYQEAIISFGREQFEKCDQSEILNSIDKFCDNFEKKHGCKVLMSSLHLDEGHKDESGNILHNYHAHVLIENYSFETHKTCLQKLDYRKLQTELAKDFERLGFVRGDPERKAQRLEHREYRHMKEQEAALEFKTIQRRETKTADGTAQPINEQLQADNTAKALQVAQLQEQLILTKGWYDADRKKLKESGEASQADYQKLKAEYEKLKTELTSAKTENKELITTVIEYQKTKVDIHGKMKLATTFSRRDIERAEAVEEAFKAAKTHKMHPKNWLSEFKYVSDDILGGKELTFAELKQENIMWTDRKALAIEKLESQVIEMQNQQIKETKGLTTALENPINKVKQLEAMAGKEPSELQAKIVSQNEQISTLTVDKSRLAHTKKSQEKQINELTVENSTLKNALEQFLDLSMMEGIIQASKSLLGRFMDGLGAIKRTFDSIQSENKQLTESLAKEKSLTAELEHDKKWLAHQLENRQMSVQDKRHDFEM